MKTVQHNYAMKRGDEKKNNLDITLNAIRCTLAHLHTETFCHSINAPSRLHFTLRTYVRKYSSKKNGPEKNI